MKVDFGTSKLEKQCETEKSRKRAFGAEPGKRLGRRLTALHAAANLEELRNAPGRLHPMTGDRVGQLSLDLQGPYRLYFEPLVSEEETPDPSGGLVWSEITHVRVLYIGDPHA